MSLDAPQTVPASDWLNAFVALGTQSGSSWTPLGAGVLIVDTPLVWLVTSRRVYEGAGADAALSVFVRREGGVTLVDLTTGRRGPNAQLEWLLHETLDLAAGIFPVDEGWEVKAFPEARCFRGAEVEPLQRAAILSVPYGLGELRPGQRPLVLDGSIARVDEASHEILTSAPLLPNNAGAPLVVTLPQQSGGGVALAGIAVQTLAVPESHRSSAAPVRLTATISVAAALELIRSPAAKAQRQSAIASAKR